MLDAAADLLERGELFGIYPEGTRSPDGRLYRGKIGVAWLALTTGAPVHPVAINGTEKVLPVGSWVPRPAKIGITIGEPLKFAGDQPTRATAAASPTRSWPPSSGCPGRSTCLRYAASRQGK